MLTPYEKYAAVRDQKGLNDCQVAEKTGLSRALFTAWKTRGTNLRLDNLSKIANTLECPITDLIGEGG